MLIFWNECVTHYSVWLMISSCNILDVVPRKQFFTMFILKERYWRELVNYEHMMYGHNNHPFPKELNLERKSLGVSFWQSASSTNQWACKHVTISRWRRVLLQTCYQIVPWVLYLVDDAEYIYFILTCGIRFRICRFIFSKWRIYNISWMYGQQFHHPSREAAIML